LQAQQTLAAVAVEVATIIVAATEVLVSLYCGLWRKHLQLQVRQ
jgi:hypothetical protein